MRKFLVDLDWNRLLGFDQVVDNAGRLGPLPDTGKIRATSLQAKVGDKGGGPPPPAPM